MKRISLVALICLGLEPALLASQTPSQTPISPTNDHAPAPAASAPTPTPAATADSTTLKLGPIHADDKMLTVTGPKGSEVAIKVVAAKEAKTITDAKSCQTSMASDGMLIAHPLPEDGENKLSIGPVAQDDKICVSLYDASKLNNQTVYSAPETVTVVGKTTSPEIYVTPTPGHTLVVKSYIGKGSTIYVYEEAAAKVPTAQLPGVDCGTLASDMILTQSFPAEDSDKPQTLKLNAAIHAGDTICVTNYQLPPPHRYLLS
jgi:hypothetical protein